MGQFLGKGARHRTAMCFGHLFVGFTENPKGRLDRRGLVGDGPNQEVGHTFAQTRLDWVPLPPKGCFNNTTSVCYFGYSHQWMRAASEEYEYQRISGLWWPNSGGPIPGGLLWSLGPGT